MSEDSGLKEAACSFCGRTVDQVKILIAEDRSHKAFICEKCVLDCLDILLAKIGGVK